MDISFNGYFHIRVHRPKVWDASFGLWSNCVSNKSLITREGGGYDKVKHRFIRPHCHIYLHTDLSHIKLRESFKKAFPTIRKGNADYSIQKQKNDNLLSYILKGGYIRHLNNFPANICDITPPWREKKELFRDLLLKEISFKKDKWNNRSKVYQPYGYYEYLVDTCKFCREKDIWLPRNLILRYAYKLDIVSVDYFLEKMGLWLQVEKN